MYFHDNLITHGPKIIRREAQGSSGAPGGRRVHSPCSSLPGCISEGDNREEALHNIKEAIELYLEVDESEVKRSKNDKIAEVTI
jgi:HicB_like antitoxin of bacterial toxin-antitoxin system